MADFNFNDEIVTLSGVEGLGYTHDSVIVTVTATMFQGSLLADDTEVATVGASTVNGAIDDLNFRRHREDLAVGDEIKVAVAKRGLVLNESALVYTDGAIDADGKAALAASGMNKFSTVANATDII